jgi:leucyl-tRNA synthetase
MDEKYFPEKIEERWQKYWAETRAFEAEHETSGRPSFYRSEARPSPSGFPHMEQVRNYSIGDALSWYKRLSGCNVPHTPGRDILSQPDGQPLIKRGFNSLREIGLASFDEPGKRLMKQVRVTNLVEGTNEWKRMSLALGNDVDPEEMIAVYGADALRLYLLFAAPPENELRWHEAGIEGALRFLRRVYTMAWRWNERLFRVSRERAEPEAAEFSQSARALRRQTHRTIARVTGDFYWLRLNTGVAALMELSNALGDSGVQPNDAAAADLFAVREALEALIVMLAPFAPHIAEEMWEAVGHEHGLLGGEAAWPLANEELARKEELEIPVQVNGKLRSRLRVAPDVSEADLRAAALENEKVRRLTKDSRIVKVIVVPRRLVNIVIN